MAREYIDIWELLPETWQVESAEGACCHSKRPCRSLVTDINVWVECYATLAAILSCTYPEKARHFFAYLRTIFRVSWTFESSAWLPTIWRTVGKRPIGAPWIAALYSEAFAGRAKMIPRCRYCLVDTHTSPECPHAPAETTPEYRPSRGPLPPRQPAGRSSSSSTPAVVELCCLYNAPGGQRCRYTQCRFAHLCSKCKRPHPASDCGGDNPKRPRTQSPPTTRPSTTSA